MSPRNPVIINLRFIKFELTLHQFGLLLIGITLVLWALFNLHFSMHSKYIDISSEPSKIKTNMIQVVPTSEVFQKNNKP